MNQDAAARGWRAAFVTVTLTLVAGAGAFFFALLLFGTWFLALLVTLGVMALVGCLHYLLWGRALGHAPASPSRGLSGSPPAPDRVGIPSRTGIGGMIPFVREGDRDHE